MIWKENIVYEICSICPGVNVISNKDALVLDRESCMETKTLVSTLLWKLTKIASDSEKYMTFAKNLQEYFERCEKILGGE